MQPLTNEHPDNIVTTLSDGAVLQEVQVEEQIREKVKVSAVWDQDSLKFERREGKEQHCYTSITKTCQTQRTSLETSTYPQFETFPI